MRPALVRLLALPLFVCLNALTARAQTAEADLRAHLINKPLFLRGGWIEDKLEFDGAGQPDKPYKTGPPTVCGFRADDVFVSGDILRIYGVRVGVKLEQNAEHRVVLPESGKRNAPDEKITVQVDGRGQTDFTGALKTIFADKWIEVTPVSLPSPGKLLPLCPANEENQPPGAAPTHQPCRTPLTHVAGAVKAPTLLKAPDPDFTDWARRLKYSGNVEVYLIVDEQGLPAKVRVVRPVGLGLDEQAVAAVEKYRFAPATQGGQPVPVDLYVEVNFQIF